MVGVSAIQPASVALSQLGTTLGSVGRNGTAPHQDTLYQTARLTDLLAGRYGSGVSLETVREHGDFGIGTYVNYDGGEMALLGGAFYSLPSPDAAPVELSDLSRKTPFTMMTHFQPQANTVIEGTVDSYRDLSQILDRHLNPERHYALLIEGIFRFLDLQCVQPASSPSLPFERVQQRRACLLNYDASLVGFRMGLGVESFNKPGYHFHAVAKGRGGGHVLDLAGRSLKVSVQQLNGVQLISP